MNKNGLERKSTFDGFLIKKIAETRNNAERGKVKRSFDLNLKELKEMYEKQKGKCSISGIEMTYLTNEGNNNVMKHPYNISIDRIDSDDNYYNKDNVQLVCGIINRMKWNFSMDQVYDYLQAMKDNHSSEK